MGCWRERGSGWARTGPVEGVGQTPNDHQIISDLARGRGQWMMAALGDMGEELAQTLAALELLCIGGVATTCGLRIRSCREL
jgi:hypothetical protein